MNKDEMFNVLIHYADWDYLLTLTEDEMTGLYKSMFGEVE